jgi:hypothetical protein
MYLNSLCCLCVPCVCGGECLFLIYSSQIEPLLPALMARGAYANILMKDKLLKHVGSISHQRFVKQ